MRLGYTSSRWSRSRDRSPSEQRREASGNSLVHDLGTDEMDMTVDSAGCDDPPFGGEGFSARTDLHSRRHPIHKVRIAGFADPDNATVTNTDVRLDHAPIVEDHRVGDDQIECPLRTRRRRGLSHPIPDDLPSAELGFLTGNGEIAHDFDDQIRVGEAYAVSGRRTIEIDVLTTRQVHDETSDELCAT